MPPLTKIALLATGDEIINGDIINSNAPKIAEFCIEQGWIVGFHMVVGDDQTEIREAMELLLTRHQVVICTGGLGPTSDDRTRFALGEVVDEPLIFDESAWQSVLARFAQLGLPAHESNRQQALFPQNASIIPNPNGTAAGCWIEFNGKIIILLPGPPTECLPMLEQDVLPILKQRLPDENYKIYKWRLFGVSEGEIAARLDDALKTMPGSTGYRIDYPYLEFKIKLLADDPSWVDYVNQLVSPYLLSDRYLPSHKVLWQYLEKLNIPLEVVDDATGGRLQVAWERPANWQKISFSHQSDLNDKISLSLKGLTQLWDGTDTVDKVTLNFELTAPGLWLSEQFEFPYRQERTFRYAVEFISHQMVLFFRQNTQFLVSSG